MYHSHLIRCTEPAPSRRVLFRGQRVWTSYGLATVVDTVPWPEGETQHVKVSVDAGYPFAGTRQLFSLDCLPLFDA